MHNELEIITMRMSPFNVRRRLSSVLLDPLAENRARLPGCQTRPSAFRLRETPSCGTEGNRRDLYLRHAQNQQSDQLLSNRNLLQGLAGSDERVAGLRQEDRILLLPKISKTGRI